MKILVTAARASSAAAASSQLDRLKAAGAKAGRLSNTVLAGIAETAPGEAGKVCEPCSSALEILALWVLVSLLADELAETPPPFAVKNEAQLSTAVITAPHDTFRALDLEKRFEVRIPIPGFQCDA
jgi:hypothetical protein